MSASVAHYQPMTTIKIASCSTGNNGCSGVATLWNRDNQSASLTVWFRNGAGGRSNFVLGNRKPRPS